MFEAIAPTPKPAVIEWNGFSEVTECTDHASVTALQELPRGANFPNKLKWMAPVRLVCVCVLLLQKGTRCRESTKDQQVLALTILTIAVALGKQRRQQSFPAGPITKHQWMSKRPLSPLHLSRPTT